MARIGGLTVEEVDEVSQHFGHDIAHDVYVAARLHPVALETPQHWANRAASFRINDRDRAIQRKARLAYKIPTLYEPWPDAVSAAREALGRLPRPLVEEFVALEDVSGNRARHRRAFLRQQARRLVGQPTRRSHP